MDRAAQPLPVSPGDRVLLCSDGVYRALDPAELAAALALPAQAAAARVIACVTAAADPHQDNATVAVLGLDPEPEPVPENGTAPPRRRVRLVFWVLLALTGFLALAYYGGLGERWSLSLAPSAPPASSTPAPAGADTPPVRKAAE